MSVTANELVRKVRGMSGDWGKLTTTLSAALTDTDTSCTLANMADLLEEELLLEIDLEKVRITAVGQTLDIERGAQGTVAATHALGTFCILEPRFANQELLDALNAAVRRLAIYEPQVTVSSDGDYTYDATVEEYAAPLEAVSILKVDMEKATAGLYRPFYAYTILEEFDPPVVRIPVDWRLSGKKMRLVYGAPYPMLSWDTQTTIPEKWHTFLTGYAMGVALENEEVGNSQQKVQTGNAGFRPGYAQQVARNLQGRALNDLEALRPATRIIRRPDQRQYRR